MSGNKEQFFDGTSPFAAEAAPAPILPAIRFDTPHDYQIARVALAGRADDLTKLAKKNDEEGYVREARIIQADATQIKDRMLPLFSDQDELPLATTEEVSSAIRNELRGLVRVHAKLDPDGAVDHEAVLLEKLGARIEAYAVAVAASAFAAGVAYREAAPEVVALKAIPALRPGA